MKQVIDKVSTHFLRLTIIGVGLMILTICVFALPAGIASDQTGLYKPILFWLYLPAIPFYIALFQGLKLLNLIDKKKAFSRASTHALKVIRYCAFTISGLFALGLPITYIAAEADDAPGVIVIAMALVAVPLVIGIFAGLIERLMQEIIQIKSENDLTV